MIVITAILTLEEKNGSSLQNTYRYTVHGGLASTMYCVPISYSRKNLKRNVNVGKVKKATAVGGKVTKPKTTDKIASKPKATEKWPRKRKSGGKAVRPKVTEQGIEKPEIKETKAVKTSNQKKLRKSHQPNL
ncbi:hypothetical protein CEXT_531041 [Caerostris extrusa]|uniref:Uncharacterized protein n=1 Tax=Caerostris extrusa TaxID=172846 RepID=A0AAV4TJ65_CAEEX|nr:hypothetical protein CEXT_531041 [Caerostris extrusa]